MKTSLGIIINLAKLKDTIFNDKIIKALTSIATQEQGFCKYV